MQSGAKKNNEWREILIMLKENGKSKPEKKNEIIKCPYCKNKIDVKIAMEEGYIQKVSGINVCDCPHCDSQFNYN